MTVSSNTFQMDRTKWNYVFILFIEDSKRLAMNRTMNAPETGVTATQTKESDGSFNVSKRGWQRSSRTRLMRCLKCGKWGHILSANMVP